MSLFMLFNIIFLNFTKLFIIILDIINQKIVNYTWEEF